MMDAEETLIAVMRRDRARPAAVTSPRKAKTVNIRDANSARAMSRRATKQIGARLRQVIADVRIGRHPSDVIDAIEDAIFIADELHQTLERSNA